MMVPFEAWKKPEDWCKAVERFPGNNSCMASVTVIVLERFRD
jgi:hypothetical protein